MTYPPHDLISCVYFVWRQKTEINGADIWVCLFRSQQSIRKLNQSQWTILIWKIRFNRKNPLYALERIVQFLPLKEGLKRILHLHEIKHSGPFQTLFLRFSTSPAGHWFFKPTPPLLVFLGCNHLSHIFYSFPQNATLPRSCVSLKGQPQKPNPKSDLFHNP